MKRIYKREHVKYSNFFKSKCKTMCINFKVQNLTYFPKESRKKRREVREGNRKRKKYKAEEELRRKKKKGEGTKGRKVS